MGNMIELPPKKLDAKPIIMVAKRPKKRSDCGKQKVQRKYTLHDKEQAIALYREGLQT